MEQLPPRVLEARERVEGLEGVDGDHRVPVLLDGLSRDVHEHARPVLLRLPVRELLPDRAQVQNVDPVVPVVLHPELRHGTPEVFPVLFQGDVQALLPVDRVVVHRRVAERRFHGARGARDEDHVPAGNPPAEDLV